MVKLDSSLKGLCHAISVYSEKASHQLNFKHNGLVFLFNSRLSYGTETVQFLSPVATDCGQE